jgi:class 3 adenylate cyclase
MIALLEGAMREPVERRLAAILAADVVAYSRLMGADEEGTLERLKSIRRQLIDPKIREHRGRIVKTTGDGILAEFPSVVDAVRCAVELQRAMVDRNTQIPGDKRIILRMGINLGDIIGDGDDIYGDGVNIAARLEALAEPGGICISRVVRDQIRDKLPYPFADMGEQRVKNIVRPVRSYAMSAAAAAMTAPAAEVQPGLPRRRSGRVRTIIAAGWVRSPFWVRLPLEWRLGGQSRIQIRRICRPRRVGRRVSAVRLSSPAPRYGGCLLSSCLSQTCPTIRTRNISLMQSPTT